MVLTVDIDGNKTITVYKTDIHKYIVDQRSVYTD